MEKTLFTIDGGNTNLTIGIHKNNELKEVLSFTEFHNQIENYEQELKVAPAIYSSVKTYEEINRDLFPNLQIIPAFEGKEFFGMPVNYTNTIGIDRLIGSLFCFQNYASESDQKIALIDAGTFLTIDFIDKNGLAGGYIFPGLDLLRNTYQAGEQLHIPEIHPVATPNEVPHSTEQAIHSAYTILMQSVTSIVKDHQVILTGGNAKDLADLLPNSIQVQHLMHKALRCAANYEKKPA
jgi:pantothenate kinase type III